MICEKCWRSRASWLDEWTDWAVCNDCARRDTPEGLARMGLLTHADAVRRARWNNLPVGGDGDEAA